jgi:hypothetical protein
MARYHGNRGKVLMSTSGAGTATPVASMATWSLDAKTDYVDVTAFGDTNKQYVAGLPDYSGAFSGFWDDTDTTVYTGQTSSTGVKMYLYPDYTNKPTVYWYGLANVDYSINADAGDAVKVSGSFSAAGNWGRY